MVPGRPLADTDLLHQPSRDIKQGELHIVHLRERIADRGGTIGRIGEGGKA